MLSLVCIACVDASEHEERGRQNALMRNFFSPCIGEFLNAISHGNVDTEVCGEVPWERITCRGRAVDGIWITDADPGRVLLQYTPSSVRTLGIATCRQKYAVEARHFPREAKYVELRGNKIFGSIDLTALPRNLEWLSAPRNRIEGPISLTMLPPKFEKLDLSSNNICQETVLYGFLPDTVSAISLEKNKIERILTVDECPHQQAKIIFRNTINLL